MPWPSALLGIGGPDVVHEEGPQGEEGQGAQGGGGPQGHEGPGGSRQVPLGPAEGVHDGDHPGRPETEGEGQGVDGPHTKGTYVWFKVEDWPRWEEKFIRGPYIHHVTGVHGNASPVLYEACRYIDGLEPDPIEPDAPQIAAWLRGQG